MLIESPLYPFKPEETKMPFYFSDPTPPPSYYPFPGGQPHVQPINTSDQAFLIAKEMRKAERRARRELLGQQETDKKNKPSDPPKKFYQKLTFFETFLGMLCLAPFVMTLMATLQIQTFKHLQELLNATFK